MFWLPEKTISYKAFHIFHISCTFLFFASIKKRKQHKILHFPYPSIYVFFTCFLRVFPIFYLLFCRPYYFFQIATISAFPLPFLPFSNYN